MLRNRALLWALDLASMPALATLAREQPLPDGVIDVIRIAAGCDVTLEDAARQSGKDLQFIKAAAEFYVQQILLFSTADSHRILGVRPGASREEMRTHMRWLMIWLHPDHAHADWQTVFARRVLEAWRDVRSAPVTVQAPAIARGPPTAAPRYIPWVRLPIEAPRRRLSIYSLLLLIITIIVVALALRSGLVEAGPSWITTPLSGADGSLPDWSWGNCGLGPAVSVSR